MGISLGEFAGMLTAMGAFFTGIFAFLKWQGNAQNKIQEARVEDVQEAMDDLRKDADRRINELRSDFEWQRGDLIRQLTEVKQAMTNQGQIIHRQEIMLGDYARHVGKLERIMAAASLEIPDFETSSLTGGVP